MIAPKPVARLAPQSAASPESALRKPFARVFLDMDGVLANFIKGACEVHGQSYGRTLAAYYRRLEVTGRPMWAIEEAWGMPDLDPWPAIRERPRFWAELEPYPWLEELLSLVRLLSDRVTVLTSPIACPHCYGGKFEWHARYIGDRAGFIPYSLKHEFAAKDCLLIDDSDDNLDKFRDAGGCVLRFPQPWNSGAPDSCYQRFGPRMSDAERIEVVRQKIMELCQSIR